MGPQLEPEPKVLRAHGGPSTDGQQAIGAPSPRARDVVSEARGHSKETAPAGDGPIEAEVSAPQRRETMSNPSLTGDGPMEAPRHRHKILDLGIARIQGTLVP
jgi:hypothetical protein